MKIAFIDSGKSFLPELFAYVDFLKTEGHHSVIVREEAELFDVKNNIDLVFRFGGFLPKIDDLQVPEIHEYHSASTGRLPRVKNFAKSYFSSLPKGRVFLNETVRSQFYFGNSKPWIYRDMGVDKSFFEIRSYNCKKRYDLVYAGSISGRPGLLDCIVHLASRGLYIGLAGAISNDDHKKIKNLKLIDFVGKIPYESVANFLTQGRFGLNFCPDIYPLNIQTSTKALEYLAAGIGIVSNKYEWIDKHSEKYSYRYLDVSDINGIVDLNEDESLFINYGTASNFAWSSILTNSNFVGFLKCCAL